MKDASGWRTAGGLAVLIAVFLLALTPLTTLWDRDEPRFAQAAVEMRATGDYLVPSFNGEVRPEKPPLIYWLMTLSIGWFGEPREIAVRFWSPIGIALAAIATYVIGRRLWSPATGLRAMVVLAATPLAVLQGVAATTDAVLLGIMTAAIAVGADAVQRPPRWWHLPALGLLLGLGALTKGPVAIVVPVAVLASTLVLIRRDVQSRGRVIATLAGAALLASAMFAAWFVPAVRRSETILARGPVQETIARLVEVRDGHGVPLPLAPFYYPAVIAIGFLPWVVGLPRAARGVSPGQWRARPDALLAAWVLVPLLAFTLAPTKLPHYILPIWPALALAVAARTSLPAGARAPASHLLRPAAIAAASTLAIGWFAAPMVERLKPVPAVAQAIRSAPVDGPLFAYEFEEPSLVFYTGRRLVRIVDEMALVTWARAPGPALLAAPRSAIERIERQHGPLRLREIAASRGWNHVKGSRLELVAFVRAHDR